MTTEQKVRRQRFEVKTHIDPYSGLLRKDVFINDKLFEWEIDEQSWKDLLTYPTDLTQLVKIDIMNHFCESLSDFLGRKISPGQIIIAMHAGWI